MKTKLNYILVLFLSLFTACKKENSESSNVDLKNVEVKISYSENYSKFSLFMSMQVTNVNKKLESNFNFLGIESSQFVKTDETIINRAEFDVIPLRNQTIKTSHPISSFGIFLTLPYDPENKEKLSVNFDFYVEGNKTSSKKITISPSEIRVKGFVLFVNDPSNLLESDSPQ